MSSTQRTQQSHQDSLKDKTSTQQLEKILLSSQTSSSRKKMSNDMNKIILQTQDNNSVGQHTYRGGTFNNTGKNWRKLITPAQDSFKKLQQHQPEYSGYNVGSRVTTQNDRPIGATTNSHNTSMDTGHYSSVKEFSPNNDLKQLKMTIRGEKIHPHHLSKQSHLHDPLDLQKSKISTSTQLNVIKDEMNDEEEKTFKKSSVDHHFGASTSQMKSLMKSFSNGNFQFYQNLEKKYFDKAKDKSQKSSKPPTASQILDKSEKDLFTLTSKTGTLLGISQLKNSTDSYKGGHNDDKPSILRASSLQNKQQLLSSKESTMSINYKNSLYKKMNPSIALLDDNSSSQIQAQKESNKWLSKGNLRRSADLFDSSSSSDQEEELKHHHEKSDDKKQPIDIQQHIMKRQIEILGGSKRDNSRNSRNRSKQRASKERDPFEEAILLNDKMALSRRDLSSRHDDTPSLNATPENHNEQMRKNKFHRENQDHHDHLATQNISGSMIYPRSKSNNVPPSGQSSIVMSGQEFENHLGHSQFRNHTNQDTHIIFEQPTKEDALEDTYRNTIQPMRQDLKPEDLTTLIDQMQQSNLQMSQMSNHNDILKTYQDHVKMARNKLKVENTQSEELPLMRQRSNFSHQNSVNNIQSEKQGLNKFPLTNLSSAAPAQRQKHFIGQSMKTSNIKEEQKSDFTFLSNPTEFQCDCNYMNENSFITNKHAKLNGGGPITNGQNSDMKSQEPSYRKMQLQNKLQDLAASPIYSENGGLPPQAYYGQCQNCQNCGGGNGNGRKIPQRLSYNNIINQSIQEESQDEDDEYYQNKNIKQQVFEYKKHEDIISGEISVEQQQQHIEINNNSDVSKKYQNLTLGNKELSMLNVMLNVSEGIRLNIKQESQNNLIITAQKDNLLKQSLSQNSFDSTLGTGNMLDSSSKNLLEINDRLTKQIETNLALFDNLNNELSQKELALFQNQQLLSQKNQEVEQLKIKLQEMNDNMRSLIEVTKMTSETTESSKIRHLEQMQMIRKKQEEYQKKIAKIQQVYSIDAPTNESSYNSNNSQDIRKVYSKYSQKMNTILNCIPLTSPEQQHMNPSQQTSLIKDEEMSLGQIQKVETSDFLPTRLNGNNKENVTEFSLLQSNVLHSLYNNLKESVNKYKEGNSFTKNETAADESSAMLKYSQDVTHSFQKTLKTSNKQRPIQ